MPLTENELRDLLRDRSAATPATPDRVDAVRTRVAKQRRRELAAVSGALALVVAAGALWAMPRQSATPVDPASPSPSASPSISSTAKPVGTTTTKTQIGGLDFVITGPAEITGTEPFDVTMVVTNLVIGEWTGTIAVGLASDAEVPGMFEGGLIGAAGEAVDGYPSNLGVTLPDPGRQFSGVMPAASVTLGEIESKTWTVSVQRDPSVPAFGRVTGWLPMAQRDGDAAGTAIVATQAGEGIPVSPVESNLSCATVTIGTWERGEVQPWTLDLAYTAVVGADGKVTWEEIAGLGDQGTGVTSTQTGKVRSSTVMRALGDLGAATPSGFGAETPDLPTTLAPGRYVAYSGTQLVPITFAGTCGPSGDSISGTWTAYNDRTKGLLDCDAVAAVTLAQPVAAKASGYCPKG